MATKVANFGGPNPHTSGLFADMTLDGPEIGTLVLVVDRAKNLPNRKTMGKQSAYCAARLGKEAKKTETDRRGGQTPKWDGELRFTVHDSPDYNSIKISVFSEDKRTDLVGEAWVSLTEVIVPGGGKMDLWQQLNYKGKYAGELRIEFTYYDERPRPETVDETDALTQDIGSGSNRVKRRPLPSNPNSGHVTPDTIQQKGPPGRAKHGPRDFRTPPRANSMPPEMMAYSQMHPGYAAPGSAPGEHHGGIYPPAHSQYGPQDQYYGEYSPYEEPQAFEDPMYSEQEPLDLPQLPPSNRQRGALSPQQQRYGNRPAQMPPQPRPQSHIGLPHSQSAPIVPTTHQEQEQYGDEYQLSTDYPEQIPDLEYQHSHMAARRLTNGYNDLPDPYASRAPFMDGDNPAPPPPPMHSNSSPAVPLYSQHHGSLATSPTNTYGATPPTARHPSIPTSSPLQSFERRHATPQRTPPHGHPPRGVSLDGYTPSPEPQRYNSSPSNMPPGQTPSPYARQQPPTRGPPPHRHSIADSYNTPTPPRPHPLSQQMSQGHGPRGFDPRAPPGSSPLPNDNSPYQYNYRGRDAGPMIKPRAISPKADPAVPQPNSASRPRSSYSIQHPVRALESADSSPLSTSQPRPPQASNRMSMPTRKSVSPHPAPTNASSSNLPFSPDSFDVHNPNIKSSTLGGQVSPHSPYQIQPGSAAHPREETTGPIVGWNGREIDPSDHLPVDSWAPEPEKKVPVKTYGLGRDQQFGPRSAQPSSGSSAAGRNLSKDTVVNVRMKMQSTPPAPQQMQPQPQQQPQPTSPLRNRLQKRAKSMGIEPPRDQHDYASVSVPNPYEQQYSRGFYQPHDQRGPGGGGYQIPPGSIAGSPSFAPPGGGYSVSPNDNLSREISSIDIGGGGRHARSGSVPAPVRFVPVRSFKDRNTYY